MSSKTIPVSQDLSETAATKMLCAALEHLKLDEGLTQREVAHRLGYSTAVVVSHMASGRVPIPVERAFDIAEVTRMDPRRFLLAVLEQRFPSMNIRDLFGIEFQSSGRVASRLDLIAGCDVDDLDSETISVLEEVVAAAKPRRRWLTIEELALVECLRRNFPGLQTMPLTGDEVAKLEHCLKSSIRGGGD